MISSRVNNCGLDRNTLKIIAALSMLIDHIGVILLPDVHFLRIIGRIAFPIYAFMIAEGCVYTRNRLRYFLSVFLLGIGCQLVYHIYDGKSHIGILITFSLSILVVYALQNLKSAFFGAQSSGIKRCGATVVLLSAIAGVYFLNKRYHIDYGFWGCMAPAFASLYRKPRSNTWALWEKLDDPMLHILMLGICLVFVSCASGGFQIYSLFAIPLLMLYSGKSGKFKMKLFFYIFYPAHLVILECISFFFL